MLGNISVVEIGNTQVEENKKQEREIKNGKIKTIFFGAHHVLNFTVDTEYPKWLYQQVYKDE